MPSIVVIVSVFAFWTILFFIDMRLASPCRAIAFTVIVEAIYFAALLSTLGVFRIRGAAVTIGAVAAVLLLFAFYYLAMPVLRKEHRVYAFLLAVISFVGIALSPLALGLGETGLCLSLLTWMLGLVTGVLVVRFSANPLRS